MYLGTSTSEILGIELSLFLDIAKAAELACLQMLLALLEGTTPLITDKLGEQQNDAILLQNMDNVYKNSFQLRDKKREVNRNTAVSVKFIFLFCRNGSRYIKSIMTLQQLYEL